MEDSSNNNVDNTMLDLDLDLGLGYEPFGLPIEFEDDLGEILKWSPMESEHDSDDELSFAISSNFAPNDLKMSDVQPVVVKDVCLAQYVTSEENLDLKLNANLGNQNGYQEATTQKIVSLEEFRRNGKLILEAFAEGMETGGVQPIHVSDQIVQVHVMPTSSAPTRRKSAIRARNIHDELPAPPQPEPITGVFAHNNAEAVEQVAIVKKPLKRMNRALKPKLHQLDPELFPKAKGAVYSRQNRQKKKEELEKAKETAILAERKLQHLQERINVRDAVIRCFGKAGSDAVMDLQKEDARLYKERFPEN